MQSHLLYKRSDKDEAITKMKKAIKLSGELDEAKKLEKKRHIFSVYWITKPPSKPK